MKKYILDVPEFMSQTLKIIKVHMKKHFLCSNVGQDMKSVIGKTGNAEERK